MLKLASGPFSWAKATDLWNMNEKFGIGRSFDCIQAKAQAAKLRTLIYENWEKPIVQEARELRRAVGNTIFHDRLIGWHDWYKEAYSTTLLKNQEALGKKGITKEYIEAELRGEDSDEENPKIKKHFQSKATKLNLKNFGCDWESRIQEKLKRWKIDGIRRWWVLSFQRNMAGMSKLVAPRVAAAVWGLAWNRWCTARRFQRHDRCMLGCEDRCDSAEHYFGCKVARQVGWKALRLPEKNTYEERKQLWLAATDKGDSSERTCWHLLVYAVFMTTNRRRESRERGGEAEEVKQWVRNAVEGHPKSAKALRDRWVSRS